jgi:betaine lipid synthase
VVTLGKQAPGSFDRSPAQLNSATCSWGIRLGNIAFALGGVSKDVKRLISSSTTVEQDRIWQNRLRPIIMNPVLKFILGHPIFCWNALGVPRNQLACLLEDGTIEDFISATLDPIPKLATLKVCVTRRCAPN